MQLVYNKICNLSIRILQNIDKNAGFLKKVAKMGESRTIFSLEVMATTFVSYRGNINLRFLLVGEGLAPPVPQIPTRTWRGAGDVAPYRGNIKLRFLLVGEGLLLPHRKTQAHAKRTVEDACPYEVT